MRHAKLIKVFEKKRSIHQIPYQVVKVITRAILFTALFPLVKIHTGHSIFMVYEDYIICHTPLFFWKNKKLFYYNKIDYINIFKAPLDNFYYVRIYLLQGQSFKYKMDSKQYKEFVEILEKRGVIVSVDI